MIPRSFDVVGLKEGRWGAVTVHCALEDLLKRDIGDGGDGVDITLDDALGSDDGKENGQESDGEDEEGDDSSDDEEQHEDLS